MQTNLSARPSSATAFVMPMTPKQYGAAKSLLGIKRDIDVARLSGVSRPSIARFVLGQTVRASTVERLQKWFESYGATFRQNGTVAVEIQDFEQNLERLRRLL